MELGLNGKVVAITGGTSGIGEEVAMAFAAEGAKIAVCGRSASKIAAIEERFSAANYEIATYKADVAQNVELEGFADAVAEQYGKIDIWINNAGINIHKPFDELSEEQWHSLVNTNFKSVFFGCAFAAKHMKKTGGGVIINTSSFTSIVPTAGKALYSAVKSGVDSLTKTFSIELAANHIRVVSIAPGYVVTPLTEENVKVNYQSLVDNIGMNRLARPDDMVGGYLFLASDAAAYINGICLPVAGAKLCTQNPKWSWNRPTIFV